MNKYKVVINHEEQYSIWPENIPSPRGWKEVGRSGSKEQCLDYIEEVWTDMRQRNVRATVESTLARLLSERR